jgi:hypothetical protein
VNDLAWGNKDNAAEANAQAAAEAREGARRRKLEQLSTLSAQQALTQAKRAAKPSAAAASSAEPGRRVSFADSSTRSAGPVGRSPGVELPSEVPVEGIGKDGWYLLSAQFGDDIDAMIRAEHAMVHDDAGGDDGSQPRSLEPTGFQPLQDVTSSSTVFGEGLTPTDRMRSIVVNHVLSVPSRPPPLGIRLQTAEEDSRVRSRKYYALRRFSTIRFFIALTVFFLNLGLALAAEFLKLREEVILIIGLCLSGATIIHVAKSSTFLLTRCLVEGRCWGRRCAGSQGFCGRCGCGPWCGPEGCVDRTCCCGYLYGPSPVENYAKRLATGEPLLPALRRHMCAPSDPPVPKGDTRSPAEYATAKAAELNHPMKKVLVGRRCSDNILLFEPVARLVPRDQVDLGEPAHVG